MDPSQLPPASDEPPQNVSKIPDYQEIPGYVSVTFGQDIPVKPPTQPHPQGNPPPMTFTDLSNLDEESCRQARYQFVSEHCCYGSKPVKEIKITDFKGITAIHYILETSAEGRSTMNAKAPYIGGPVDGPENGPPPLPWTFPCTPDQTFRTHSKKIEVPHTSVVCCCPGCDQRGWNRRWHFGSRSRAKCTTCDGDGRVQQYDSQQQRQGTFMCHRCHGDGLYKRILSLFECMNIALIDIFSLNMNVLNLLS
ncbi:hypothetical protein DPMN_133296 [Dreissena polymorpha]|uniref:Protein SSUH2 homolog n=1 Tax=Dreissena polymorpha TaxID=45954 RepID=A0A9D4FWQ9_DREPO|nr:hypothetical protein DPMN_133296 [Dreissena polymorpha]